MNSPSMQGTLRCNHKYPSLYLSVHAVFSCSDDALGQWQWLIKVWMFVLLLASPVTKLVGARDVSPQHEHYIPDYRYYHNVSHVGIQLKELVARNPSYIRLDLGYKSRTGVPQYVLHLSNFSDPRTDIGAWGVSAARPKILLSFGEHAREFFPVESLFHLLSNLTGGLRAPQGSPAEAFSRSVLSRVDLYVIAMANPDGRLHVERTKNYCWRGTGVGVDLNRNFDWSYGGTGSSANPKDEEYRGPSAQSEPECQVYLDLTSRYSFDAFLSLHSGIRQIYLPFADSKSKKAQAKPAHIEEQMDLAQRMAKATHSTFSYGLAYNLNDYPADGTVFDFMAGVRKIPFSFAIELWGEGDNSKVKCFDLFNPPHDSLQDSVMAVMPIYETLFTYMVDWKRKQVHKLFHGDKEPEFGLPFGYILVLITFCLFVLMVCHQYKPYGFHFNQRKRVVSLRALSSTFVAASGIKMT